MVLRLKVVRRLEQRINKVKDLMDMYSININPNNYQYQGYQPTGASSLVSNTPQDPRIQKTKDLFQMFHLVR
jgi:hypothetical protein